MKTIRCGYKGLKEMNIQIGASEARLNCPKVLKMQKGMKLECNTMKKDGRVESHVTVRGL